MLGLSFLFPAFLFGAAAVAVPIVLHLVKREAAPQVPFSAVRFLKRAPVEHTRRKRLRELLLLALRVTALVLVALAFARPYFRAAVVPESAGATVVAVDTSFSMGAPGQFAHAKQLAGEAVDRVPPGDLVGVLSFSDAAELVMRPSVDRSAARAVIDRLTVGYGATRYRTALAQAAAAIGPRRGRIVVVTDLQRGGWEGEDEGSVPERVTIEVADAGAPAGNLAARSVHAEPGQAVAVVFNSGLSPERTGVTLTVNGRPAAATEAIVPAGGSAEARFTVAVPESGVAVASVEDRTGYPADNTRYMVLDPPEPVSLLAVTTTGQASDALYVERALLVGDAARRFLPETVSGKDLALMPGDRLVDYGAVLLLSTRGLDRKGRDALATYVRRGGGLFIAAGADVDPSAIAGMFGGDPTVAFKLLQPESSIVTMAPADARHPIFRAFGPGTGSLGQVRFQRTVAIDVDERAREHVVARFSNGTAALAEIGVGGGRVLIFGSDLNHRWNDFPIHPTFLPFVHESMRYLAGSREQPREYVVADAPAGARKEPGVFTVGAPSHQRRVAINVDTRESDETRLSVQEFRAAVTRLNQAAATDARTDAAEREEQQRLWRYGLMLLAVVLATEGIVGARLA